MSSFSLGNERRPSWPKKWVGFILTFKRSTVKFRNSCKKKKPGGQTNLAGGVKVSSKSKLTIYLLTRTYTYQHRHVGSELSKNKANTFRHHIIPKLSLRNPRDLLYYLEEYNMKYDNLKCINFKSFVFLFVSKLCKKPDGTCNACIWAVANRKRCRIWTWTAAFSVVPKRTVTTRRSTKSISFQITSAFINSRNPTASLKIKMHCFVVGSFLALLQLYKLYFEKSTRVRRSF